MGETKIPPNFHLTAKKPCGSNRTRPTNQLKAPLIGRILIRVVTKGKPLYVVQGNSGSKICPQKSNNINRNENISLNLKRNTFGTYYTQTRKKNTP